MTLPSPDSIFFRSPERIWIAAPLCLLLVAAPLLARAPLRRLLLPLFLRSAAALALLAVLLDPRVPDRSRIPGRLLVLADVSPSVGAAGRAETLDLLRGARFPYDIALFGSRVAPAPSPLDVEPRGDPEARSDIAAALSLALARAGAVPLQVLLLSDGRATEPGVEAAAAALRERGIPLFARAIPSRAPAPPPERSVAGIEVPPEAERMAPFPLTARLLSSAAGIARVRLFLDGLPAGERLLDLAPGENLVRFEGIAPPPGRVRAQVALDPDLSPEDDLGALEFVVPRTPRILLLAASARRSLLAEALRTQGLEAEVAAPSAVRDFSPYDAVAILPDAPVEDLEERMEAFSALLGRGGGLLAVGGSDGEGLARLHGSPLGFLLPLDVPPRPPPAPGPPPPAPAEEPRIEIVEEKRPAYPISLCLLIDRSGSMAEGDKLRRAQEAALAAAEALTSDDRISVVAFNEKPDLVVAPVSAGALGRVAEAISRLTAQGQTGMFGALAAGFEILRAETAPIRHMVLLSDGISTDEGPWRDLLDAVAAEKITLSTVGIGFRIDERLPTLARWGRGKYWIANHPSEIPQVVTLDTTDLVLARGRRGEDAERPRPKPQPEPAPPPAPEPPRPEPETPPRPPEGVPMVAEPAAPREALLGLEDSDLPEVAAYEEGRPRAAAWVAARAGPGGPPLLAYHRIGLGTAASLAVDPEAPASKALRDHEELPRLVAQLFRSILPDAPPEEWLLESSIAGEGNRDRLDLRLLGEDGRPLAREVTVVVGGRLLPSARRADRHEVDLPPGEGPQLVSVSVGGASNARLFLIPRSTAPERLGAGPDREALRAIAGERLDLPLEAAGAVEPRIDETSRPMPLPFLLLAAILLPFDAWVRRKSSASR